MGEEEKKERKTETKQVIEGDLEEDEEEGSGCCWRRSGSSNANVNTEYELQLPNNESVIFSRAELALLWRYRIVGPHVRARKVGERRRGFRPIQRYSISEGEVVKPADPTQIFGFAEV